MSNIFRNMTISALGNAYKNGKLTPAQLFADIRSRAEHFDDHNIWIHLLSAEEQAPLLAALEEKDPATHPLWGIPFAIKDNIDLAAIPTTAACKEFAYTPNSSATVVQQLIDAGAIPVGKTNLDQFATGLNGTRSPWGPCRNSFKPDYVSGGSSAGSSVSVALGLVSFSLGTDTAGSGRVPACLNNLVGVKPTIGLLSATGMLPACRSLDCITIFALDTDDANTVLSVAEGFDDSDAYSRENPFDNLARHYGERAGPLTVGVIPQSQLQFFGDEAYAEAYAKTLQALSQQGFDFIEIDYEPFAEAARLLYEGPWVAERYLAALPLVEENPLAIFPVVRQIIEPGGEPKATELFTAEYRLRALKAVCDKILAQVDCLLTPTAGRAFTIEEMLAEPILHNSQLGFYTNFMNLLDYAAVAVPTQMASSGMPFGITLCGQKFKDRELLSIARRIHRAAKLTLGATGLPVTYADAPATQTQSAIDVVVCGAHLEGLPLNWQLQERGASLKQITTTAPHYRMYALAGGPPYRPGLIYDAESDNSAAIEVEVWSVPAAEFGSFVAGIPAPLGIGKVQLADNSLVTGFICEPRGVIGAEEITHLAGWRNYMETRS